MRVKFEWTFSGFGHLFATQLSCDSRVAFLLPVSRKYWQNGGLYLYGKNFLSLIKTRRSVRAYKSEPVPSKALDAVLEAGTYPAQEAGQPAARKQNYIVRTICGEEGKHADK